MEFKNIMNLRYIIAFITAAFFISTNCFSFNALAQESPEIKDSSLKVELITDNIMSPTSMAFLSNDTILLNQKHGTILKMNVNQPSIETLLELKNVISKNERGLLGLEIKNTHVYIYVTEEGNQFNLENVNNDEIRNRVYKFVWDGQNLSDPQILLDVPAGPGTNHQGGKIKIGPDEQLYIITGELQREGQLQNIQGGQDPDDSGVIFRIDPNNGLPSEGNPFASLDESSKTNLDKYFAYGIRNSFGFDFDPITGKLWDAENGQDLYDEINLVEPGFNSGWKLVMGPISNSPGVSQDDLVSFDNSKYSDPLLSWEQSRGITDLEFFDSNKFGAKYENNIFVGDITRGNLFFLEVNENRDGIKINNVTNSINDLVITDENELASIILGTGFNGITDIEAGPDGNLYILTYNRAEEGQGALYRISPM